MQIHELNNFSGIPGELDFLAIDTGYDTAKISAKELLSGKIDNPAQSGTEGQILRNDGNGSTEWSDVGLPTDAQTAQAISDWLAAHPEATTTVQDGSLTESKFSSALKLSTIKDYYTPYMFGAVGDGVIDDAQALLDCAAACVNDNMILLVPEDCTLNIPNYTVVVGVKQLAVFGEIKAPNGIEFTFDSHHGSNNWYFSKVNGDMTLSGLMSSFIQIDNCTKVILLADDSISNKYALAYNTFQLGKVDTLIIRGRNTGWINENYFHGGRMTTLTFESGGSYPHNHNHFFNNCLESATITFDTGRSNYIHNARMESIVSCTFGVKTCGNVVHRAWTAEDLPGSSAEAPTWWHDNSGLNYYARGVDPFLAQYTRVLTFNSYNYNMANRVYPLAGKLHLRANTDRIIASNLIDITHGISYTLLSDKALFRLYISCYDENGVKITTKPTYSPLRGTSAIWDNSGKYYYVGASMSKAEIIASKIQIEPNAGQDTGVSYITINLSCITDGDVDFVKIVLTAPNYAVQNPFKIERMTAPAMPVAGDWSDGDFVYNTDPSNHCLGWFYNNGAWHQSGAY